MTSEQKIKQVASEQVSSYSFMWNQEVHAVTVKTYNSLGRSESNVKMTLNRQPKREFLLIHAALATPPQLI